MQCKQTKIDDNFSLILNAELGLFSFHNAESRFLDLTMSAFWKGNTEERDVSTCNYLLTFMTQDFPSSKPRLHDAVGSRINFPLSSSGRSDEEKP